MRVRLHWTPVHRDSGLRPRRGRNRPPLRAAHGDRPVESAAPMGTRCKASAFPQCLEAFGLPHFPQPRRRNHLQTINQGVGPFYVVKAIYIRGGIVRCKLHLKRCSCLTKPSTSEMITLPSVASLRRVDAFPESWRFHVGITGGFRRNTQSEYDGAPNAAMHTSTQALGVRSLANTQTVRENFMMSAVIDGFLC